MRYGNSFGLLVFFPLAALITIKHKSKLFTYLMVFSAVAISLSLITTLVRGVWLGVIAGIIVMSLYAGRRKGIIIFFSLLIVILGLGFGVESVRHRAVAALDNLSMDDSRIKIWRANIQMFKEHPLLGVGNDQNEAIIQDYFTKMNIPDGQVGHAHNIYLQFLSGTGVFGFLFYMFFIIYFLIISHRLLQMIPDRFEWHRALILGGIGAQVFLHVGGLTEPTFKHAEVKHMFLFLMAIVATIYCRYRNEHTLLIRRPANEGPGYHGV